MSVSFLSELKACCLVETEHAKTGQPIMASLTPDRLVGAAAVLRRENYHIEDICVSDVAEGFELKYHFDHFERPGRITFRVLVPHEGASVPSISAVFPGADWHERECFDFFGLDFAGHGNLYYLLLPEDAGIHPLVKAPENRKALHDVTPHEYLIDCGLGENKDASPAAGNGAGS